MVVRPQQTMEMQHLYRFIYHYIVRSKGIAIVLGLIKCLVVPNKLFSFHLRRRKEQQWDLLQIHLF